MTRGIRNNNPGNIRHSSSRWKGMTKEQTDSVFVTFKTMIDGIRALLVTLRTYYVKHHLMTCSQVIERYAPPSENLTKAYTDFVKKQVYYDGNTYPANCWNTQKSPSKNTIRLAKAICWIESQYMPTDDEMETAISIL